MKTSTYVLLALILITIIVNGCKKSELATAPKNKMAAASLNSTGSGLILTVSSPHVSQNYPDTVGIQGTTSADSVQWFVSPPTNVKAIQKTNSRYILAFTAPGTYQVKAVVNGADSVSTLITVTDSIYPPLTYHSVPLTNDIIKLTPHFHSGNSVDSTYLYFDAQTTNGYACSNSYLEFGSFITSANNFIVSFNSVQSPDSYHCSGGSPTIWATVYFKQVGTNYVTDHATYPLTIKMNGITYTGSIVFLPNKIKFDWNYNSGIIFTAKQISR